METGVQQWLMSPSGERIDLNDLDSDPDGGFLVQRLPGLDGAGIRATIDNLPQKSGGIVHPFLRTPRYFTIEGLIVVGQFGTAGRARKRDQLAGALDEMLVADGRYYFVPPDGVEGADERFLTVRHHDAFDSQGDSAGVKDFQAPLVAYDPVIYGRENTHTISAGDSYMIPNYGTTPSWPVMKVYSGDFELFNATTGLSLIVAGASLGGGYAEVNMLYETIYLNGNSSDLLRYVDFEESDFFSLARGNNEIALIAGGGSVEILYHSTWA